MDRRTFVSTVALGSVAAVMGPAPARGAPAATGPIHLHNLGSEAFTQSTTSESGQKKQGCRCFAS